MSLYKVDDQGQRVPAALIGKVKGRWIDDYRYPPGRRGKRYRVDCGPNRDEADILRAKRLQDMRAGINPILRRIEPVMFTAHSAEVLERHYKVNMPRSHYWAKGVIETHLDPFFGQTLVGNITSKMVSDFLHAQSKAGLERSTIDGHRAVLSKIMSLAVTWDRLHKDNNPLTSVKPLGDHNQRDRWLQPQEQRDLVQAARETLPDHPMADLILFCLGTGARMRKEGLTLLWSDVDWEGRTAKVRAVNAKGKYSRLLLLSERVMVMLQARKADSRGRFSPFVFTYQGKPLHTVRTFGKVCKKAGLGEDVTPHCLRHTWRTRFGKSGGDARDAMQLGGWKDASSMLKYWHTDDDHARRAVEKASADLDGGQTVDTLTGKPGKSHSEVV